MTERNKATQQRIRAGVEEAPSKAAADNDGQAVAIATVERQPSKKRYGHQPSQVGSRLTGKSPPLELPEDAGSTNPGGGAASTGPKEVGGSRALADLREFSFAEDAAPDDRSAPSSRLKQ